jgi:hypothetical protein
MRPPRRPEVARYERRVRYGLTRLPRHLRERIAEQATRAVTVLRFHVTAVEEGRDAESRSYYCRKAANALRNVLFTREPLDIVCRAAAIALFNAEEPSRFPSDEAYRATLLHEVRKLAKLADRFSWDQRRAHTRHGGQRQHYITPPVKARQIAAAWTLDALSPLIAVLLKVARDAEALKGVEAARAFAIGAEAEEALHQKIAKARVPTR